MILNNTKKSYLNIKIIYAILIIVPTLLYSNTLQNDFAFDDIMVIKNNTLVTKGITSIPTLLSTPHLYGYINIANDFYRPLSLVMFAIEYQFLGTNPMIGHLINIIVYIGCIILLFRFLIKIIDFRKYEIAFLTTLLFAIHPIHTEVVANIKSRDELLCFFFAFLSLNVFTTYAKNGKLIHLFLGSFFFFLAFISKETVITFLAIIPLIFFFYFNEKKQHSIAITISSVFATLIFLLLRTWVLHKYQVITQDSMLDFLENALAQAPTAAVRFSTEFWVLGKYLQLLFIPYPLLCNYSYNKIHFVELLDYNVLLSILIYTTLIVTAIYRLFKYKKDIYAFGILFYLITITIFSNVFILIGSQMSERFLFFPSVGFCIIFALFASSLVKIEQHSFMLFFTNKKILLFIIPITIICSSIVIERNKEWKDTDTLFKSDFEKSPNDCRLNCYYAKSLHKMALEETTTGSQHTALLNQSIFYLNQALFIYPAFAEAHAELGIIYFQMKQYDSAETHVLQSMAICKQNGVAAGFYGQYYLAGVYYAQKKYAAAINMYQQFLTLNPTYQLAQINLARCYMDNNQFDSAILWCNKILANSPDIILAQQCIAKSFFQIQKFDSAETHFKILVALKPNDLDEMTNLGVVYINEKNYPQAITVFQKIISLNPNYVLAYANLGMAYYNMQSYHQAIEYFKKEISLNNYNSNISYIVKSYQQLGITDSAKLFSNLMK